MSDPVIASLPIPRASIEQFAGPIAYAGEVAANLFAAGGRAVILRMGYHQKGQDEHGQLVEAFAPGLDPATDEVFVQAICDRPPDGGHELVNPFLVNLWPLSTNKQPTTIADALGERLFALPQYKGSADHFALPFASGQAFYLLRKMVSSIFAVAVARGATQVEFILSRGEPTTEKIEGTRVVKVKKKMPEKKRDANGNLLYTEASESDGRPIFDAIYDRTGNPRMNPSTGEIMKIRRIIYETEMVDRDVEEFVPTSREVAVVPVYLQVTNLAEIANQEFSNTHAYESHYDPTWMLTDVLAGRCKDKAPFQDMEV